jgi:DNA cross-link repair 1A protein
MTANWSHGPIYCSSITANLVLQQIKVSPEYVIKLPMYQTVQVEGVDVTLIDANQYPPPSPTLFLAQLRSITVYQLCVWDRDNGSCPGSVLFLFEKKIGRRIYRILHCGDFRASPAHIHHPSLKGKYLDAVYLDTTYLKSSPLIPPPPFPPLSPLVPPLVHFLLFLFAPVLLYLPWVNLTQVQNTPSPSKKT